jgi:hypothetical protein
MSAYPVTSPDEDSAKWRAQGDFDTLKHAEEIFNDKPRLKAAIECGEKQKALVGSVVQKGLRNLK